MKRKGNGREGRKVCEGARQGVVHVCLCRYMCVCNIYSIFRQILYVFWKVMIQVIALHQLGERKWRMLWQVTHSLTHIRSIPLLQFQLSERVSALTHQLLATIQTHMAGKSCWHTTAVFTAPQRLSQQDIPHATQYIYLTFLLISAQRAFLFFWKYTKMKWLYSWWSSTFETPAVGLNLPLRPPFFTPDSTPKKALSFNHMTESTF